MTSDGARAPQIKLSLPLVRWQACLDAFTDYTQEYQQDLFTELRGEDELVVLARGLGSLRIITNLLHSYDVAGNNLIVIVGADERENAWIGEALAEHAAISRSPLARGLTQVNTDFSNVSAREKAYAQGGIFSITSRILIVDLLSKLLNPELITGLVVLHADKVVATSTEAFIVRCYRQNNKNGFLKAFSDNPESLASGFNPLAATLRNLFLRKPSLWPRFHATVAKSLEGQKKAEVIEFDVPMSSNMRDIQNAILECVEVSISELRRSGTGIELDDWTIESALHRNFDVIIRRQLDPVWHRTNFKTRQIVSDLVVLRSMLNALLTYDAVSFHKYMEIILASNLPPPGSNRQNQSPWMFLDAANIIFDTARRRVYIGNLETNQNRVQEEASLRPVLEEQPKWSLLAEILDEIERDTYLNPTLRDDSNGTILIMCSSNSVCKQIREYLQTKDVKSKLDPDAEKNGDKNDGPSAAYMMRRKLRDYLLWKKNFSKANMTLINENKKALEGFTDQATAAALYKGRPPPNKRRRVRGGSAVAANGRNDANDANPLSAEKPSNVTQLMDNIQITAEEAQQKEEIIVDDLDDLEDFFELYQMEDLLVVHPFDGDMDDQILEEVRPRYIIMYEADAAFIRRIEVYRSSHNDRNIRIYFMYYGTSVEEQRYLTVVRKEKDAFTKLIKERGSMSLTITHDADLLDPQEQFLRTVNTRIAGGGRLTATAKPPLVIVDVREFNSSLPSLLHGRSMRIIPAMLTVADYVLSPTICIERKSVTDLIQSFKNGRLFNQAETMLQHYKSPMLLIEFDQNKSFTLDKFADSTSTATISSTSQDIQSKIVMLTIAFPRLKIIWSSSPYQTAEIFEELKKNQDEPDPLRAVEIGVEAGSNPGEQSFNQTPQDMLRAVPGITGKNLSRITLEIKNMQDLSNLPRPQLDELLGRQIGGQIHGFFNKNVIEDED